MNILNKSFYDRVRSANDVCAGLTDENIKDIIVSGNDIIQRKVIEHRDGVELPEQLGYLFIGSTPETKHGNIDYKTSIKLGKEVHYKNWNTDGLTGKIFYTNYEAKYRFKYHELWSFTPVRQFKRAVAQTYPDNYSRYVQVDNWLKVSRLFRINRYLSKSKSLPPGAMASSMNTSVTSVMSPTSP